MLDVFADGTELVAREVEVVHAMAVGVEEGHDDMGVHAGVAGLAQGALVLVPAPEDGHLPRLVALQRCYHGKASKHADRNREKCGLGCPLVCDRHCYCTRKNQTRSFSDGVVCGELSC